MKIGVESLEQMPTPERLHAGPVRCISVRKNYVLTGSADATAAISDCRSLSKLCSLLVRRPVCSSCWLSDDVFCCGCVDGSTMLYDIRNTASELRRITSDSMHKPVISLVCVSSSEGESRPLLLSGSSDGVFSCDPEVDISWKQGLSGNCAGISNPLDSIAVASIQLPQHTTEHSVCYSPQFFIVFSFFFSINSFHEQLLDVTSEGVRVIRRLPAIIPSDLVCSPGLIHDPPFVSVVTTYPPTNGVACLNPSSPTIRQLSSPYRSVTDPVIGICTFSPKMAPSSLYIASLHSTCCILHIRDSSPGST